MDPEKHHEIAELELESATEISVQPASPPKSIEKIGTHNPFVSGSFRSEIKPEPAEAPLFPYLPTSVPQQILRALPYKTSNRILDDMRYTPGLYAFRTESDVKSLLSARPIEYMHWIADHFQDMDYACLVLNNPVPHAPSVSTIEHKKDSVEVSTVRGLIVDTNAHYGGKTDHPLHKSQAVVAHFKIQVLLPLSARNYQATDKIQYHAIGREMVSVDDLNLLTDSSTKGENVIDDAFFKSLNSAGNSLMRVTVYRPEFSAEELVPFSDPTSIKQRYLANKDTSTESSPSSSSMPSPVSCFQTLIKVLKGPVLLPENEATHTISRKKTHLDAKIEVDFFFKKLGFTLGENSDSLVPPNLSDPSNRALREGYIRKATELIFLGKSLPTQGRSNDFDVQFSFSDNLSQVHTLLAEVDKHATLTSWNDYSNKYAAYIALSSYAFFQDELVIRCYEHTVNSDPENKIHYVDSFKQLLALRARNGSPRLSSYYNNQFQKGQMYGTSDYRNALSALGIVGVSDEDIVDESAIVEMYKAACKQDPNNFTYFGKQLRTICAVKRSPFIENFLRTELVPETVALSELRIESLTEDEVVVTAYEYRLDEVMQSVNFVATSPEIVFLQKCLLSIAVYRKSYILMSYIDVHMPELSQGTKNLHLAESMALFGIDDSTGDFDVIS